MLISRHQLYDQIHFCGTSDVAAAGTLPEWPSQENLPEDHWSPHQAQSCGSINHGIVAEQEVGDGGICVQESRVIVSIRELRMSLLLQSDTHVGNASTPTCMCEANRSRRTIIDLLGKGS